MIEPIVCEKGPDVEAMLTKNPNEFLIQNEDGSVTTMHLPHEMFNAKVWIVKSELRNLRAQAEIKELREKLARLELEAKG